MSGSCNSTMNTPCCRSLRSLRVSVLDERMVPCAFVNIRAVRTLRQFLGGIAEVPSFEDVEEVVLRMLREDLPGELVVAGEQDDRPLRNAVERDVIGGQVALVDDVAEAAANCQVMHAARTSVSQGGRARETIKASAGRVQVGRERERTCSCGIRLRHHSSLTAMRPV